MEKDLFDKIVAALLPEMDDAGARKSLVEGALMGSPVLRKIQWDGAADTFTKRLTRQLHEFGQVAPGKPAIVVLLEEVKPLVGADRQAQIDGVLAHLKEKAQPPAKTFAEGELYVFISYASQDHVVAEQVEAFLTAAGIRVFFAPKSISPGDNWIKSIDHALRECARMVLLLSPHSMPERKEVEHEWNYFDLERKPIYPLYIRDCQRHSRLLALNYLDARGDLLPTALDLLVRELRRDFPGSMPRPLANLEISPTARRNLEVAYLKWLRSEELLYLESYTPLRGASHRKHVEMRAIYEYKPGQLAPLVKRLQREPESRKFENAVEEILRIRRAALLGEPGSGKTMTIWKLAADLVEKALQDSQAPIPLLIRLGRWTEAEQSLRDFIASQLGDLGEYFDSLLTEKRAALLLDGLNELPAGQRDLKYPQAQRLIEAHSKLMAIVSCRELDYTVDFKFDRINITPLDPLRIREFVDRYLGAEKGKTLFWKLAGQEAKLIYDRFLDQFTDKLSEVERIFWIEPQLPEGIQWGWRWQEWLRLRETPSSLMVLSRNPYMLWMLTCVYAEQDTLPENRGELFRLFVEMLLNRERIPDTEHAPLTEGLAKVAYAMQSRRTPNRGNDAGDALTALPKKEVSPSLDKKQLYWAESASILSVGEQVRFTHQLLQEYFAALYMNLEIQARRLKASEIWPPEKWWERTNWEEAAILLAGLYSDDCSRVVEWVAEANPEVAGMCAERSGAELAKATGERLRTKWSPRLTDLRGDPNPKARAAVGRALGMMRVDNRKGVGTVVGANNVALPDIDWVEIPAGKFQYGEKKQKLTLSTFQISRYPITYAQFLTFLDDPEGFGDPRWFDGMAAKDDDRRMNEQAFKFANHPREMVNWYQAMAFCRWFSWRLGGGYDLKKVEEWGVRLPTEFEWEKAARGADGRIYPYKGDFDASKGNTNETDIGQTSAVGIFPNGASPYGVMDMSGNVWEWCLSNYDKPALEARKENLRTDKSRVLRGGSWIGSRDLARAVVRYIVIHPADRDVNIGFRVVVVLRPPSLSGL